MGCTTSGEGSDPSMVGGGDYLEKTYEFVEDIDAQTTNTVKIYKHKESGELRVIKSCKDIDEKHEIKQAKAAVKGLKHEGLIEIKDHFWHQKVLHIATPQYEGGDLRKAFVLSEGDLDFEKIKDVSK